LALENLLLLGLIYPIVKGIHEFGHGYAVKRWQGEVHEMGIMFLVFIPVPYVEASAAYAFSNKYQRMLVGAAGIMVEVMLAALAMIVWSLVEPGDLMPITYWRISWRYPTWECVQTANWGICLKGIC